MPDVAELLEQLERAEVASPSSAFEADLWSELVERLESRPWWHVLVPSRPTRRTILAGVTAAAVIAMLVASIGWLAGRHDRQPPIVDEVPVELEPLPEALIGGTLPPFRATVEVRPTIDESDALVWEVSFDGGARFRQELVGGRGGGSAWFPIGSFVVSDGRDVGRLDGLSTSADGRPLFRVERAGYALAGPWSWALSWRPYCDVPDADGFATCSDWRGEPLRVGRHADSGLVTYVRGQLAELGLRDPFQQHGFRAIAVGAGSDAIGGPGDPIAEMKVVDVEWDPDFEPTTFSVTAPEGTTSLREDDVSEDDLPGWSEVSGPPAVTFSLTVTQFLGDTGTPEADDLRTRSTWRIDHDPARGWRAEALANDDANWAPSVGSLEVSDGQRVSYYHARSGVHGELPTPRPQAEVLQQVLASYLGDLGFVEGVDLTGYLASDACRTTGLEAVAGVTTSVYECDNDDAIERFWVHDGSALVLRRGRQLPGQPVTIWHDVSEFELDPDLSELDLTFTPPPGSVNDSDEQPATSLVEGELAPAWRSPLLAGDELASDHVAGRTTVLLFQAESCPISSLRCRAFDLLLDLSARRDDVTTGWVPYADFPEFAQRVVDARGFTGHVLTDDGSTADGPIRAWQVSGDVWDPRTPTVLWVVLDGDGRVVLSSDREVTLEDLETAIGRAAASG